MRQLFTLFLLFTLCGNVAHAQFPGILWKKCMGGSADEQPRAMQPTSDNGYILAGSSRSNDGNVSGNHGGLDCWIVKVSDTGRIQWQKSLGGSGDEEANAILATPDSGYIIAGYSTSNDGNVTGHHGTSANADYWVAKLDSNGNMQWQKSYGGSGNDVAQSIYPTNDGGYMVAGSSNSVDGDVTGNHGASDYWLVKISGVGAIEWQRSYGGNNDDVAYAVQQTSDEGYIVAGYTSSDTGDITSTHGDFDYWVVKLTPSGNILWQKTYGGSSMDVATCLQQTTDKGYLIGGNSYSEDGDVTGHHPGVTYQQDGWVVKTDDTGGIVWEKSLGGSSDDGINSITWMPGDNFLIAATTMSPDGDVSGHIDSLDSWVLQISSTGSIVSQKCLGGSNADEAFAIFPTADAGFVVLNGTESTDSEVHGNHGGNDYWLVKLGLPPTTGLQPTPHSHITLAPNPANNSFSVSGTEAANIKVYDALGNVATEVVNSNVVPVGSLSAGQYLVVVTDRNGVVVYRNKVVKL